jgi:AraC family transcriptional regulator
MKLDHNSLYAATAGLTASCIDEHDPTRVIPRLHIEETRSWGMISAALVNRDAGEVDWRSDCHRINLALTDMPGTVRVDDGPSRKLPWLRNNITFIPSGGKTCSDLPAGRFVHILQRRDTYDSIISDIVRGGTVRLETRALTDNPLVSQIVFTIANEMRGGFLDRILADALNTALAVQIARCFVEPSATTLVPANGLSLERLQRVREYIEENLDDRLTLSDIAGVACLSPYHFSRSFKEAVGVGPQRYVIERRIERAKAMLRRTHQPLGLIAQQAGFADQSHLTSLFRRETGVTPGQFRAALAA